MEGILSYAARITVLYIVDVGLHSISCILVIYSYNKIIMFCYKVFLWI